GGCRAAIVRGGGAWGWRGGFGLSAPPAPTRAYIARMAARPAVARAEAVDAGRAAADGASASG
ncbi:glutathione S-transferase, partial [Xanthomonas perforans]